MIFFLLLLQVDSSDHGSGRTLEADGPVPFLAALHCRESQVAAPRIGAVGGIGTGDNLVQIPHDLPVWKQDLGLFRVGQLQWPQQEPRRLERVDHTCTGATYTRLRFAT